MINGKLHNLIVLVFLIFSSCLVPKRSDFEKVVFKDLRNKPIIVLTIPKGFKTERFGGSKSSIYHFNYPDSSIVYIDGEFMSGLNYDNIKTSGTYYELFDKYHSGDTLTLGGVDKSGNYWKHITIDGYVLGYINVPSLEKKNLLDSCFKKIYYKGRKLRDKTPLK